MLLFISIFITGCSKSQVTISEIQLAKHNTVGKIEVSILPKKFVDNKLIFELRFTTHSGDLTTLNWKDLIKVYTNKAIFEVEQVEFLRKSDHHPIIEIQTSVFKEELLESQEINIEIGSIEDQSAKVFTWNIKELEKLLKPQMGVLTFGEDNWVWLMTATDQKKLSQLDKKVKKVEKLKNTEWLVLDQQGKINKLTVDLKNKVKTNLINSQTYKDIAYFDVEKLLFALNEKGDNLTVINLDNGEEIFTYKDIVENSTEIEIVGTKLFSAQDNKIKIINLKDYLPERIISLDYGQITKLYKTFDEKYLLALSEENVLSIIKLADMNIVQKIFSIQDFSYDFSKQNLFYLNKKQGKLFMFNLIKKKKEEIVLDKKLKDITVIPNTDLIYGITDDNALILFNYKSGQLTKINLLNSNQLNDNFIQINQK